MAKRKKISGTSKMFPAKIARSQKVFPGLGGKTPISAGGDIKQLVFGGGAKFSPFK